MTRILVQRGSSSSSSSSQNKPSTSSSLPSSSSSTTTSVSTQTQTQVTNNTQVVSDAKDDEDPLKEQEELIVDDFEEVLVDELAQEGLNIEQKEDDREIAVKNDDYVGSGLGTVNEEEENEGLNESEVGPTTESSYPPPPPIPPPNFSSTNSNLRRSTSGSSNGVRIGGSRRASQWPPVSTRTSPTGSRPSSPRSHGESEGYNSADEQGPSLGPTTYDDAEKERMFEMDIRRVKGLEVKKMMEDGNCLFRAVADLVYGDSELYDLVRQMCIDYMERERDHFSQFITEGFTSYCKRKRRDKVYGNNMEIQALSEMYNRPIHIYSYSTEPINIFHGGYATDVPPIRLSYHHGNHYNSLVDPQRPAIGSGLGFSSLRGTNANKDQVKAAIRAQQDQQIDNALLAEGRFYSDLELTEKEMERMVMEASRAEYILNDELKKQLTHKDSSTSGAEPSSSAARSSSENEKKQEGCVLSSSMQIVLSMGFSYMQAVEAYSIFGNDVDSIICYLLETSTSTSRRKGKATEINKPTN